MSVGEQIGRLRRLRGWESEELAWLSGLSAERVRAVELGEAVPDLSELERIAAALGMKVRLVPGELV